MSTEQDYDRAVTTGISADGSTTTASASAPDSEMSGRTFEQLFDAITANVATVLHGKTDAIELAVMCLLAEGHLLVEDVPGVGKTSLAKALAASIDCAMKAVGS